MGVISGEDVSREGGKLGDEREQRGFNTLGILLLANSMRWDSH